MKGFTSKIQHRFFIALANIVEEKSIETISHTGTIYCGRLKNDIEIRLEEEADIYNPETGRSFSSDILVTLTSLTTGRKVKVSVEYNGITWHKAWKDKKRSKKLNELGINVINVLGNKELPDMRLVLKYINKYWGQNRVDWCRIKCADYDDELYNNNVEYPKFRKKR